MTTAALLAATLTLVIVALVMTPRPVSLTAIVTGILVAAITPGFLVAVITWPRAATVYTIVAPSSRRSCAALPPGESDRAL